jgi:serine/threonine-protein kinase
LGAVAYLLLSGRHVFEGQSALEICGHHIHTPPRPLHELVPDIDPELEKLVLGCLAKAPADRPASARVLCDGLVRCPSRVDWTSDKAREWWASHENLLQRKDTAKTMPAVEVSQTVKCDW